MKAFFFSTDPAHIRCSTSELARFTKQVAVLFGSGVPLHEALEALARVQADTLSIFVIPELRSAVMNGHRFSAALARYPKVFPKTYTSLIRGSEETGELQSVMDQLSVWLEKQDKMQRHVKKALTYPTFVIGLAFLLTFVLFKTVIPQIMDTVINLGADLPAPTQFLLFIIAVIEQPVSWLLAAAGLATLVWYLRTPRGYQQALLFFHYTPVIGGILTYSGSARYTGTLAMLLRSGVDIIRSCHIAAEASGNPLIRLDSPRVLKEIRGGQYLGEVLEGRPYYPPLLVDMVKVGDESGQMAEILRRSAGLLEEDTLHRIDMFMNLLEPIVLAGVSLIVGSVLVAVLLPMSNLISAL